MTCANTYHDYHPSREDKELHKYFKYNPETNQLEAIREIQTTLNSFFLGEQHKMSSGAENIFFTNLTSNIDWFPAWSGIKDQSITENQDETGVIPPSFRTYKELIHVKPYGEPALPGNTVPYNRPAAFLANHSVYGQEIISGEPVEVNDWLIYQVWFGPEGSGILAYEQKLTGKAYAIDDVIDWWFNHPVEGHLATPITTIIKIAKGGEDAATTDLLVRESSTTPGAHYSNIRIREFANRDVSAGVTPVNSGMTIAYTSDYAADTSGGIVTLTVNEAIGYESFVVFDSAGTFHQNSCFVVIGLDTYEMNKKDKQYNFWKEGLAWKWSESDRVSK